MSYNPPFESVVKPKWVEVFEIRHFLALLII